MYSTVKKYLNTDRACKQLLILTYDLFVIIYDKQDPYTYLQKWPNPNLQVVEQTA